MHAQACCNAIAAVGIALLGTIAQADHVETKVVAHSGAEKVAKAVRDSLKVSLGDGYHVETDDGEDVVIGRTGKTPKFEVTQASSTLTGLEVSISRE